VLIHALGEKVGQSPWKDEHDRAGRKIKGLSKRSHRLQAAGRFSWAHKVMLSHERRFLAPLRLDVKELIRDPTACRWPANLPRPTWWCCVHWHRRNLHSIPCRRINLKLVAGRIHRSACRWVVNLSGPTRCCSAPGAPFIRNSLTPGIFMNGAPCMAGLFIFSLPAGGRPFLLGPQGDAVLPELLLPYPADQHELQGGAGERQAGGLGTPYPTTGGRPGLLRAEHPGSHSTLDVHRSGG